MARIIQHGRTYVDERDYQWLHERWQQLDEKYTELMGSGFGKQLLASEKRIKKLEAENERLKMKCDRLVKRAYKDGISKGELIVWLEEGCTITEIAKHFNVSRGTINNRIQQYGIAVEDLAIRGKA